MCDEPASGRRSSSPGGKSGGNGDTDDHPARKRFKSGRVRKAGAGGAFDLRKISDEVYAAQFFGSRGKAVAG